MLIDETIDLCQRRSSSAWAKYALAFRRISLARRSSRTSFSKSVMRRLSSLVIPGASPESTWFCFTQLRRVFLLIPICSPTSRHAALTHSQRGFAGQLLIDHTHSTVTNFCRVLTRCRHVPILSVRSSPPPYPGRSTRMPSTCLTPSISTPTAMWAAFGRT